MKEYRETRRRREYLASKRCYACGSTENLELDHRDPSTKISHAFWGWSRERLEKELAKCDVMCQDCHKLKTLLFDRKLGEHGTNWAYRDGCRCNDCREAQRQKIAQQRENRKKR